jgi:glycosidase
LKQRVKEVNLDLLNLVNNMGNLMKRYKLIYFLVIALTIGACIKPTAEKVVNVEERTVDFSNAIFYEIFVQSFADSDGDGIGDIVGMTSKLDYLDELGVDVIWLMPMSPSPSYHKYDVTDYRGIHPDYGTLDNFKDFITAAHERNISVVMDFVINHSGSDHPWFQDAKTGPEAKYRDYYVWANKDSIVSQIAKKETSFDSDNVRQWHPVDGDESKEHFYGFFHGGMPDMNYDNPVLRKEMYDIGKFWLSEVGVDGFRLDAAKHIYPDERATDSQAFWIEFKSEMEKVNPNVYLIGEVWSDAKNASPYAAGFSSLFNFDRAFSILESVNQERVLVAEIAGHGYKIDSTGGSIPDVINSSFPEFKNYNEDFYDASFLSNHDQNRTASVLGEDPAKIKLAASLLFTLPGTPYVYYGEEIGMSGRKPDENIREPYLWDVDSLDASRTSWMIPKYTTQETVDPLSAQMTNEYSVYAHYKKLIALKKEDVLSKGDIQNIDFNNNRIIAFSRTYKEESVVVIHNLSAAPVALDAAKIQGYDAVMWSNGSIEREENKVILAAKSSIVYKR